MYEFVKKLKGMISLKDYIQNSMKDKVYKRIVMFDLSDDSAGKSLRPDFCDFLHSEMGFDNQSDQSTYAQKYNDNKSLKEVISSIEKWGTVNKKSLNGDEFIEIYECEGDGLIPYIYKASTDGFICINQDKN